MKRFILILFFFIGYVNIQAQQLTKFDDIIEINNNGTLKFHLNSILKATYKDCADYYMIANFNKEYFLIHDTLKIYYKTGEPFITGYYNSGKKQGKFTWFHKNGNIKTIGEYILDKRSGIWEYYHSNGKLYKKLEFKNNKEYLIDLVEKSGKVLVKNGEGFYKDNILLSSNSDIPGYIKGKVTNGLPTEKWNIFNSGIKMATEYFENNSFVKGISHSIALGDTEYKKEYLSTFSGAIHLEFLKLFQPMGCRFKSSLNLTRVFFNGLKKEYLSSDLKNIYSNNWFIVEIKTNDSKILNVEIYSNAQKDISNQLKKTILEMDKVSSINIIYNNAKNALFLVEVYNNQIYFPTDKNTFF